MHGLYMSKHKLLKGGFCVFIQREHTYSISITYMYMFCSYYVYYTHNKNIYDFTYYKLYTHIMKTYWLLIDFFNQHFISN